MDIRKTFSFPSVPRRRLGDFHMACVSSQVMPPGVSSDTAIIESFKLDSDWEEKSLGAEVTIRGTDELIDRYVQNLKRWLKEAHMEEVGTSMVVVNVARIIVTNVR